jgi:hypothetical protein
MRAIAASASPLLAGQCLSDAMIVEDHGHAPAGAAAQFFCETPSQSGTSGELGLASDTYDECVYREDTLVLLELTTRDMMEVLHAYPSASYVGSGTSWQALWSCDGI